MKRRSFMLMTAAGTVTLALPIWYYKYRFLEYDPILSEPELLSYIWANNTIQEIGRIYRNQHPDENSQQELVTLLFKGNSTDTGSIAKSLQQLIKKDYEVGNITMVDGWLLSLTEARQCALYSLTQND